MEGTGDIDIKRPLQKNVEAPKSQQRGSASFEFQIEFIKEIPEDGNIYLDKVEAKESQAKEVKQKKPHPDEIAIESRGHVSYAKILRKIKQVTRLSNVGAN